MPPTNEGKLSGRASVLKRSRDNWITNGFTGEKSLGRYDETGALVDPLGVVFDSTTGALIDGAQVTLIERSAQMHALLAEGLERAMAQGGEYREIVSRMTLLHGDAKDLLPELAGEAVLIDPMHPPRKNSALVKQDLRQVREIVGTDDDASDLMRVALAHARQRVVLKWPAKADPMAGIWPCSHQILGKSTRYDVFMVG